MDTVINYDSAREIGKVGTTSLTTSEQDLVTVTYQGSVRHSQYTLYINTAIPVSGSVTIRLYCSPDNGTTWYQTPWFIYPTNGIIGYDVVINSTSPTQDSGTSYKTTFDVPASASTQWKVTGKASGSTTLNALTVMARNN